MEKIWRLADAFSMTANRLIGFAAYRIKADRQSIYNLFFKLLEETGVYAGKGKGKLPFGRNFVHKQIRN